NMTSEGRRVVQSRPAPETRNTCKSRFWSAACAPVSQAQQGHRAGDRRLAASVALSGRTLVRRPLAAGCRSPLGSREGGAWNIIATYSVTAVAWRNSAPVREHAPNGTGTTLTLLAPGDRRAALP